MDTEIPMNKFGRAWKPGITKSKRLQAPQTTYYMTFDMEEDEEIMGIAGGFLDEEDAKSVISRPNGNFK